MIPVILYPLAALIPLLPPSMQIAYLPPSIGQTTMLFRCTVLTKKCLEEKEKEEADKEEDGKSGIFGVSNMSFLSPATKCSPNSE
jgi:hypothetical protein